MPGMVDNADDVLLGRGKVYFDRFDSTGAKTGERYLGNCTAFEISGSAEKIEKYSSSSAAAQLLKSDVLRTKLSLRIVGDEISPENLAMALFGDKSSLTQTASSAAAEPIAGVLQGYYYALAYREVSNVVVEPSGGGTPFVVGTDYEVDATTGRIYIIPGGGIADDDDIEVDYDYDDLDLPAVIGMTHSAIKGFIRFIGDPASGPILECQVWRASVAVDGAIGFLSDEYANMTLTGEVESDSTVHPSNPHYQIIKLGTKVG